MTARQRQVVSIVLAVIGCVLALIGGVALYAREQIFDSDAFADNAAAALKDDAVTRALADPITDQAIDRGPDALINARPVLLAATEGLLESTPFRSAFRKGARKIHKQLFSKDRNEIALTLANVNVLVANAVAAKSPKLAQKIPPDLGDRLVEVSESDAVLKVVRISDNVRFLGLVLPPLALLALLGSVAIAVDRRRALLIMASALVITAAIAFVGFLIGRAAVLSQFEDDTVHDAVAGVWNAFMGGLGTWILGLGFISILIAASAAMASERDALAPARRSLAFATRTPETAWGRAGRAVGVGAASLLLVLEPSLALQIVAVLIGAYGLFFASCELLALIAPEPMEKRARDRLPSRRMAVAAAAIMAVIVIGVIVLTTGGDSGKREISRPPGAVERCNGFAQLCDKPLNEVVFPASHNAMSAAKLPGWYQPNQRNDIRSQLDDGIRAFLIDSHYGIDRPSGPILTDFQRESNSKILESIKAQLGSSAVGAFQAISGRYGKRGGEGKTGEYFCHVVCELGSTSMARELDWFKEFLQTHPDEVLILFIEDKVSPTDTERIFEKSGILPYAYIHKEGQPFPAMRQLIESDKRLFVMAEENAAHDTIPWLHQGFDLSMETPYTFHSPEELAAPESCAEFRGGSGKPFFQLNNWVEKLPRSPRTAQEVNGVDFLLRRARLCQKLRQALPNILAVDYSNEGDVVEAAQVLDGIPRGEKPSYRTD
jgi:hypothetical protein